MNLASALVPLFFPLLAATTAARCAEPVPAPVVAVPVLSAPSVAAPVASAPLVVTPVRAAPVVAPVVLESAKDVRAKFVELAGKKDEAGLVALWKANPSVVLPTIDADLEGSLRVREKAKDKEPDMAKIKEMHERALFGARMAYQASGDPLILDYASSFVGWDEAQRKSFREGQAASARAGQAMEAGDGAEGLKAGTECLDKALALGDWWGAAMGCDAVYTAHRALGNEDKALEFAARAGAIHHSLGFAEEELRAAVTMAELCKSLKRPARGQAACERALTIAKAQKNDDLVKRIEGLARSM